MWEGVDFSLQVVGEDASFLTARTVNLERYGSSSDFESEIRLLYTHDLKFDRQSKFTLNQTQMAIGRPAQALEGAGRSHHSC
jgi:hypothetical protein